jgi:hypothetical protein
MQAVGFEVGIWNAMKEAQHLAAYVFPFCPAVLQRSRGLLLAPTGTSDGGLVRDQVDLFQQQALQPEVGDVDVGPHDIVLAPNNLGIVRRTLLRNVSLAKPPPLFHRASIARHNAVVVVSISRSSMAPIIKACKKSQPRRSQLADGPGCVVEHVPHVLEEAPQARQAGGRAASELALAPDGGHPLAEAH